MSHQKGKTHLLIVFCLLFQILFLMAVVQGLAISVEDFSQFNFEELHNFYNLHSHEILSASGISLLLIFLLFYKLLTRKKKKPYLQLKTEIEAQAEEPSTYSDKIRTGLSKTRQNFLARTVQLFQSRKLDDSLIEDLEESLLLADVGPRAASVMTDSISSKLKNDNTGSNLNLPDILKEELRSLLKDSNNGNFENFSEKPFVILVVGVNGVGKTTTIGKLARLFSDRGLKVILAAGDTFRAAAIEQLEIWAERSSSQLIKHKAGSDPAAVVFDAMAAAKSRSAEVVIIDTAGRLHTKTNLMEELKKIRRVIEREIPGAPHEVLLVVDATSGQNVLQQARIFHDAVSISGIALTKLDGTAKGGIVVAVKSELGLPVKFIGVGEGVDDLKHFNADDFVNALF